MHNTSKKRSAKARKIVDAALVQFERHGFQATSLEQIAAEADMGKSTLYDYFKSKEELFTAAFEAASDQWIGAIERIIAETDDPLQRLEHFTETILGFADDNHACRHVNDQRLFIEILMQTVMAGGVFYQRRDIIRTLQQRVIRLVTNILLEGVSQGRLRPEIACHAEKLAINFLAYLNGMKYYDLVAADHIDVRAQIAFFMKNLTPLLLKKSDPSTSISCGSENDALAI